jgi:TRAP-type mannitol/chloroaromatic compound transport system substrate-binding protein
LTQAQTTLRVQLLYAQTLPVLGEATPWFAEQLREASDGQLVLRLFDPGALVDAEEILEAVSTGRIDVGSTAAGFHAGKISAAPIFSSVPFGPEAPEYLAWMFAGNGLELYQEMYDQAGYNIKVLPLAIIPPETAGWFKHEINSVEDIRGLNIRFYGLGGQVMQKLGASVSLLPPGEIFPALERGVIDATEFSLPTLDQNLGFHRVADYNYFPGWHQQATFTELLINKDVWENRLTAAQRKLLEMISMATITYSLAVGEATQGPAIRENVEEHGVEIRYFSDELLETFRRNWAEVAQEQAQQDEFFARVWEDLQAFRAQYEPWNRLAFLPRPTESSDQE